MSDQDGAVILDKYCTISTAGLSFSISIRESYLVITSYYSLTRNQKRGELLVDAMGTIKTEP